MKNRRYTYIYLLLAALFKVGIQITVDPTKLPPPPLVALSGTESEDIEDVKKK